MIYLTVEQIIFIHNRSVERFGGAYGIRDRGLLEASVARPAATFGGIDLYRDIYSKAAAPGHSILLNHPFIDGNKRTAFTSMDLFLQENGLIISADDDECEKMILNVVNKIYDDKRLAEWLKNNTILLECGK
ncbi:MAG: type II toxin-antitoxin system death-on-curing family toxin [Candidatus Eremiobacterota bacterium]